MKILFVTSHTPTLTGFRKSLILHLFSKGHIVYACGPPHKKAESELKKMGVQFFPCAFERTGINPFKEIIPFLRLVKIIKKTAPDLLFCYLMKTLLLGSLAGKITRTPAISMITGKGYLFTEFASPLLVKITHPLLRFALRSNEKIIFHNEEDKKLFQKRRLLSVPGYVVNGSGVDTSFFTPSPLPKRPVFLFITRLIKQKGILEYADAAKRVKERHPKSTFLLVGVPENGPAHLPFSTLTPYIEKKIITYYPPQNDIREVVKKSNIYVLPSYTEGVSLSGLEAMAMGRMILASDVPGTRKILEEGKNGHLFPPKNVDALVQCMTQSIQEQAWEKMGKHSRKIALRFDKKIINQNMTDILVTFKKNREEKK